MVYRQLRGSGRGVWGAGFAFCPNAKHKSLNTKHPRTTTTKNPANSKIPHPPCALWAYGRDEKRPKRSGAETNKHKKR